VKYFCNVSLGITEHAVRRPDGESCDETDLNGEKARSFHSGESWVNPDLSNFGSE
jgi:hypothetical protein